MAITIVLDRSLAPGLAANAAAVLAMSIGKRYPDFVGEDLPDRDGDSHPGITSVPIPILASESGELVRLRESARAVEGLWIVDFTHTARAALNYESYALRLASMTGSELRYVGIALAGERDEIKRLTGSLPLFR